ncbi:MAG: 30S ribosomal protein S5 [Anaplasmataceae bacterium]|nr:30S ribosomal protein S5 [Anaplasmataceae bacterium]
MFKRVSNVKNDLYEEILDVRHPSHATTGGRSMSYSVLVAVGDKKCHIGIGSGNHKELPEARAKAIANAKKNMYRLNLMKNKTIPHPVYMKYGSAVIFMKPSMEGNGIVAGGLIRKICFLVGIKNITTKSFGSSNANNIVLAVYKAFRELKSLKNIAYKRDKNIGEIIGKISSINIDKDIELFKNDEDSI